ncbi:putative toxin YafO [compost metagenome]
MNRVDVSPLFLEALTDEPALFAIAQALIPEFRSWWNNGQQHPDFGRNVPYHRPKDAKESAVMHVHIVPLSPPATLIDLKAWRDSRRDFKRTSNRHLIYAASDCGWAYLLAYEHEDAHEAGDDHAYLEALAKAAEAWFAKTRRFPKEPTH